MNTSKIPVIYILAILISIGPLSTDMYLASLPDMSIHFSAPPGYVQLTLGVYLVGWAFSMLIVGPLSDYYGRKPVISIGLLIYISASFLCSFSYNIDFLIFFRLLQSFGAAAATVVARATVRDIYEGEKAAKVLSFMGTSMALVPALSPILGGYLHNIFFWEANFIAMALVGSLCFLLVTNSFTETLEKRIDGSLNYRQVLSSYLFLLRDRQFLGYTGAVTFGVAGSFTFVSSSSFVLQDTYQVPSDNFGFYFGCVVFGFICGTIIGANITKLIGIQKMVFWGTIIAVVSSSSSIVLSLAGMQSVLAIIIPQVIYYLAIGIIGPQGTAGALTPHPEIAGKASSLISFFPVAVGSLIGFIATALFNGTQYPMIISICLMAILINLSFYSLIECKKEDIVPESK